MKSSYIDIETKHTLAANLLLSLTIEELKEKALRELSSGINYLPTVLEFNAAKTDDVHYCEYLYVIISYEQNGTDIESIKFIDANGIDYAIKEMIRELSVEFSDLGFDSKKAFAMTWLSDYDEDDIQAFDD